MTEDFARTEWARAIDALGESRILAASGGFDGAASRAYDAAFHAVSALFGLEGKRFTRHSAVEVAVHRDLVKAGRWTSDLGRDFSLCVELRGIGDYGTDLRIDEQRARDAIAAAERIVRAVGQALPIQFPRFQG